MLTHTRAGPALPAPQPKPWPVALIGDFGHYYEIAGGLESFNYTHVSTAQLCPRVVCCSCYALAVHGPLACHSTQPASGEDQHPASDEHLHHLFCLPICAAVQAEAERCVDPDYVANIWEFMFCIEFPASLLSGLPRNITDKWLFNSSTSPWTHPVSGMGSTAASGRVYGVSL